MTSLVVWVATHTKGAASLNMLADNRISWETSGELRTWDHGRKVFASRRYPIIVGYVGDVVFPVMQVPALLERLDAGDEPVPQRWNPADVQAVVDNMVGDLRTGWNDYPMKDDMDLYIGYRFDVRPPGRGIKEIVEFKLLHLKGRQSGELQVKEIKTLKETSKDLVIAGSGAPRVRQALERWNSVQGTAHTSRAIFSGFVDAIVSGSDPRSSHIPQMGSLYRIGSGRILGITYNNSRYYGGLALRSNDKAPAADWRDATFQRVTQTGQLIPGAHPQPRPGELT